MNTVYPIFFDSWTGGNFLAMFINQHFGIKNHTDIILKDSMDAIEVPELYHRSHVYKTHELKESRSHSMTKEQLDKLLSNQTRVNFENGSKYTNYAAPYLFHEPVFFDKELLNNIFCIVKPVLIYWEPSDNFIVNRQVVGHNIQMNSYDKFINLDAQRKIKNKFKQDGVFVLRLQYLLEENENEYMSLCNYINAQPLDNWKEVIKKYKNKVKFDQNNAQSTHWELLLYPGGHCGNYLRANILTFIKKLTNDIDKFLLPNNEYTSKFSDGRGLIRATHHNFTDEYEPIFNKIRKAILIYNRDKNYLLKGQLLNILKGDTTYADAREAPEFKSKEKHNFIAADEQVNELKAIYENLAKRWKDNNTEVYEIEWKDLFINPTMEEYKRLCDFYDAEFSFEGYNHLVEYVNKNIELLEKYNVSV